jgi:DNA polymerase III subunit alpha
MEQLKNINGLFYMHNHSDISNLRLKDSTNKIKDMVDYVFNLGGTGLALTDHEALCNHVAILDYAKKQKEKGKLPQDFKIALGNEIYLVDQEEADKHRYLNDMIEDLETRQELTAEEINELRELREFKQSGEKLKFYHFILIAKNKDGHQALRKLSTQAWKNSFWYRGMERVPTYKHQLRAMKNEINGNIISTSACLGGELPTYILEYSSGKAEYKQKIHDHVLDMIDIFGQDNYYLELQPSKGIEQITVNKMLLALSKAYNLKCIISTDSHYLNRDQARTHEIYLNADDGDREVASFYATTYFMDLIELRSFFVDYLSDEQFYDFVANTNMIKDQIEDYDLNLSEQLPIVEIPEYDENFAYNVFSQKDVENVLSYNFEYTKKFLESQYDVDRYYMYLIAQGYIDKKQETKHGKQKTFERIDMELKELWLISERLNQRMSSYFATMKDIIDIMWEVSLVGVSRGSAAGYYTNYLLDIVQINPIEFKLPHWRHITATRPELPDIDIDTEGAQRDKIIALVKEKYGSENVLNICTFTTEKTKSTILTVARGLGIDVDIAHNISSLIPNERGIQWSLEDCLFGNEELDRKPHKPFIDEIEKYDGFKDAILQINGLISGRSQHAAGVIIFPNGYVKQNAMMKTTSGGEVTQYDMNTSQQLGGVKYDFLTINALDRIRKALDLLLENGKIEWQGSLRATYNKYFHPDVIEWDNPKMFELLYNGDVLNAFQFETPVGGKALLKIKPQSYDELCAGNSLMRLGAEDGESPLDKYVRFKNDISQWYKEMEEHNLTPDQMELLKTYVVDTYGMCDTQEKLMMLSMDPQIANFDLTQANKLRKGVAKVKKEVIAQVREMYYKNNPNGDKNLMDYVWNYLFKPQFGYAFSSLHVAGYTAILIQEMYIAYKYGSIWWKTACLTVNAGLVGDKEGTADYGAISKAIGDMKGYVLSPCINRSTNGFTPLEDENKILFGLKPISGLGSNAVDEVIANRPYVSFEDFVERVIKTNKVSVAKGVTLIKSGAFDNLTTLDRRSLMVEYVKMITPPKAKITMVQYPKIMEATPPHLHGEKQVFKLKNLLFGKKPNVTKQVEEYFLANFGKVVEYNWKDNGTLAVDKKSFEKEYKKRITGLQEWVKTPEALELVRKQEMQDFWIKYCMGSIEKWEMETNAFYTKHHELDYVDLSSMLNIVDFYQLPEEPFVEQTKKWRDREIPQYKLDVIVGTVIDKNKIKNIVSVLTKNGVVNVKFTKGAFVHYDKKIVRVQGKEKQVLDESWFKRGTHLALVGFRRGDEFIPRTYKHYHFEHTTMKIDINNNQPFLRQEKARA